ncbi:MAG: DNA primase [Anaerolineales bacterium]|nr:DNA primase [Anaerolineales bacterium]
MNSTEEIKARLDIVDIVSETVQLKRSGKNYTGFCPFHQNVRTPSFVVFPESGTWRCFGECNDGGDIFKYVMKKQNWDFFEALQFLAEKAGVELKPRTPEDDERDEVNGLYRELLETAVRYYQHHLTNTPTGQKAKEYLIHRGISEETLSRFEIGYAPDAYEETQKFLISRGYTPEQIEGAGISYHRDDGRYTDRFRNRVMIPIRDERGRMTGFGARALDPEEKAKYLNSPQTELFDKSHTLFGLDKAKTAIRNEDQVIIVEGYMGVIVPHQYGFENVVAQMGTALTEHQLRMIKKYTKKIILALDSDAAGMNATLRGLQVARDTLDHSDDISFDAHGLLRHETRLQADIRVSTLPKGQDPDDVVNEDPEIFRQIIANAKPVVEHVMNTLIADRDTDDPKVKSQVAQQVMPLIQDISDPIVRDHYIQQLARKLKVDERSLLHGIEKRGSRYTPRQKTDRAHIHLSGKEENHTVQKTADHNRKLEQHCLGMIMNNPEFIYQVDRSLQASGLDRISEQDFQDTNHQVMFRVASNSLNQEHSDPQNFVLMNLPDLLLDLGEEIIQIGKDKEEKEARIIEDLTHTILRLRDANIIRTNQQIRFLMLEIQEKGEDMPEEYLQTMARNGKIKQFLDKAMNKKTNPSLSK